MYKLNTKKERQEARQSVIKYYKEKYSAKTEEYKDIEILRYLNSMTGHYVLQIYKGSAGKPYINYYYTKEDKLIERIVEEKARSDRREAYYLERKSKGKTLTQAAQASKMIKIILNKEYPNIKFSVKSDNYSMGSSVRINWTDGIPEKEIDSFARQFQYGHFDGMNDIYEYSNKKDFPQAKFVFCNREISDKVYQDAFDFAKKYYNWIDPSDTLDSYKKEAQGTIRNYLWRTLNKMNLTNGFDANIFREYRNKH